MLKEVWNLKWKGMVLTYGILIGESIAFSMLPLYLGKAVDGLFQKDWFWFKIYLTICIIGGIVGISRRCFDTRIFSRAWGTISTSIVTKLLENKMAPSKIITRARLSSRFVDFFEFALPRFVTAAVGVIIPFGYLLSTSPAAMPAISVMIVLMVIVSLWVSHQEKPWDNKGQTANDDMNQAIADNDCNAVKDAYDMKVRVYTKQSDWAALDWLSQFLFKIGGEIVVILVLAQKGATQGELLTAIGFVWSLFGNSGETTRMFGWIRQIEVANERISEESPEKGA